MSARTPKSATYPVNSRTHILDNCLLTGEVARSKLVGLAVPSTKPEKIVRVKIAETDTSSATVTAAPRLLNKRRSNSKHRLGRSNRIWKRRSPGVAGAVWTGPLIGANVFSPSAGC